MEKILFYLIRDQISIWMISLDSSPHLHYAYVDIAFSRTNDMQGICWSKNKCISDVVLWIPTHECVRDDQLARTYIYQLCVNTKCSWEDLSGVMNDRDRWGENSAISSTWLSWFNNIYNITVIDIIWIYEWHLFSFSWHFLIYMHCEQFSAWGCKTL